MTNCSQPASLLHCINKFSWASAYFPLVKYCSRISYLKYSVFNGVLIHNWPQLSQNAHRSYFSKCQLEICCKYNSPRSLKSFLRQWLPTRDTNILCSSFCICMDYMYSKGCGAAHWDVQMATSNEWTGLIAGCFFRSCSFLQNHLNHSRTINYFKVNLFKSYLLSWFSIS